MFPAAGANIGFIRSPAISWTPQTVAQMTSKPDWDALGALFSNPAAKGAKAPPRAHKGSGRGAGCPASVRARNSDLVCYLGEWIPKWLARDLMQERAAIYEYEAGMTREEAEALVRSGLQHLGKD